VHPRITNSSRNDKSNALKYLVKYIEGFAQRPDKVQAIIDRQKIKNYTPKDFLEDLDGKFRKCKNYIKPKYVKSFMNASEDSFTRIFRTMFRNFVKFDKMVSLVHCKKLKPKARINIGQISKKLLRFCTQ
jgi:hypothetical protein